MKARLLTALLALSGCTTAATPPLDGQDSPSAVGTPRDTPVAPPSTGSRGAGGDDQRSPGADPPASPPADPGPGTTTPYSCSAAGIAAYADALVTAARKSCTSDGVGVVDANDYPCMKSAIDGLATPHATASYNIITTLLSGNTQFPMYECTYFVQTVTAGVCGTPISPSDVAWTDYPLAYMFASKSIPHYTWFPNNGKQAVAAGDIFVYGTSGGQDPGHIMIVAAVIDANHFRIAEANELTSSGARAMQETGVVSNTRVATLKDPYFAGWFRLNGT